MEVNQTLELTHIGPLDSARIAFGDLTVLVGPQATGKSIALQLLKLIVDNGAVLQALAAYGRIWNNDLQKFLGVYLGEGMGQVWDLTRSRAAVDGKPVDLQHLTRKLNWSGHEHLFYIPAQRVLALERGWPRPFRDYRAGDPFVLADFSDKLLRLVDDEFAGPNDLFPQRGRLKTELRDALSTSIFHGYRMRIEELGQQKRLVLDANGAGGTLPYLVWSAGQREFVPLLLGLYLLLPPTKVSRRAALEWAVIEEPEAGLHPRAISAVLLTVLELLARGYRVCLSTHSPAVLDVVWALQILRREKAGPNDVLKLFDAESTSTMRSLAGKVLEKSIRVHYFDPESRSGTDISDLDPGAQNAFEAGWGGLTAFSERVSDAVAVVVNRSNAGGRR